MSKKNSGHSGRRSLLPDRTRRGFLDWMLKGGIAATIAGFILPALAYLWPVTKQGPGSGMVEITDESEIPVWGSKKAIIGGSAVLVIRTPAGWRAYSAICTHLGCIVNWEPNRREIECPCHAGYFDTEGRVISGPPPKALASYDVQVIGGKVFLRM